MNFLQQYDFELIHKPGQQIPHVDAISRHMYSKNNTEESDIEPQICAIYKNDKLIFDVSDLCLENFTNENIRAAQKRDYFFKPMYSFSMCECLLKDHD